MFNSIISVGFVTLFICHTNGHKFGVPLGAALHPAATSVNQAHNVDKSLLSNERQGRQQAQTVGIPEISSDCLGCMCEASSKCNSTIGCSSSGGYFCGPFLISWAYWADAGKLVVNGENPELKGVFENCANDLFCSAETVRRYMRKFGKDCNGDNIIDCNDFALIHKIGGYNCKSTPGFLAGDFYQGFSTCLNVVNGAS